MLNSESPRGLSELGELREEPGPDPRTTPISAEPYEPRSVRRGEALLAGLLRCGHCGRKLHVNAPAPTAIRAVITARVASSIGGDRCISFGGMRIDRDIGAEVIVRLQPLGIEAALAAEAVRSRASEDKLRQVELALEQARYEVGRARRQYDAVDPDNRLVAAELETRWNGATDCRPRSGGGAGGTDDITRYRADACRSRAADDARCRSARAWTSAGVTPEGKETDRADADRRDRRPRRGQRAGSRHPLARRRPFGSPRSRRTARASTAGALKARPSFSCACCGTTDAGQGDRLSAQSARQNDGTRQQPGRNHGCAACVGSHNAIDQPIRKASAGSARREITLDEAAAALSVNHVLTVRRLIKDGQLSADQLCKGAPWIIRLGAWTEAT